MQDHDIIFDLESNKIGLIKANCAGPNTSQKSHFQINSQMFNNTSVNIESKQTLHNYITVIIIMTLLLTTVTIVLYSTVFKEKNGQLLIGDTEEAGNAFLN